MKTRGVLLKIGGGCGRSEDGQSEHGSEYSGDENSPRGHAGRGGKQRKSRSSGGLRQTAKEGNLIRDVLKTLFQKPTVYEEMSLSAGQIDEAIKKCKEETTDPQRHAIFNKNRLLGAWKVVKTKDWGFDLQKCKVDFKKDKAAEKNLGLNPAVAQKNRENQAIIESEAQDVKRLTEELADILPRLEKAIGLDNELMDDEKQGLKLFTQCESIYNSLTSKNLVVGNAELVELLSKAEKLLLTSANLMLQEDVCQLYVRKKSMSTSAEFQAEFTPTLGLSQGTGTGRPGAKEGAKRERNLENISQDNLVTTLKGAGESAFKHFFSFVKRLGVMHGKDQEPNESRASKKNKGAVRREPSELQRAALVSEVDTLREKIKAEKEALVKSLLELRSKQEKLNPVKSSEEKVGFVALVFPPQSPARPRASIKYEVSSEPLSPLLAQVCALSLAPQSTYSLLSEQSSATAMQQAERYNFAPPNQTQLEHL